MFHQPTLSERKARIRATRKARQQKQLARATHGRNPAPFLLGLVVIIWLAVMTVLLTGCSLLGSTVEIQPGQALDASVATVDGQVVVTLFFDGDEYLSPSPLTSGCYLLHSGEQGKTLGTMTRIADNCGR